MFTFLLWWLGIGTFTFFMIWAIGNIKYNHKLVDVYDNRIDIIRFILLFTLLGPIGSIIAGFYWYRYTAGANNEFVISVDEKFDHTLTKIYNWFTEPF